MNTLQDLPERFKDIGTKPFLMKLRKKDHQTYAYGELFRISRRLARGLVRQDIQPGDVVGLFAPLDFAWTAACLGALQAGAVVMPLDLQLEKKTLAGIFRDSNPGCIFTTNSHLKKLRQAADDQPPAYLLDRAAGDENSWEDLLDEGNPSLPEIQADHRAALFYTSGTTGPPKGVPLSHENLGFQIDTVRQTGLIKTDDRVLLPLPPHHVYPFVIGILAPLSLGLTIVLPHSLTGPQMVRALRQGGITLLLGVPRLYDALFAGIASRFEANAVTRQLFDSGMQMEMILRRKIGVSAGKWLLRPLRRRFGPRLRILASGGAPLAPELASKLEALGWRVSIGYGLTETAPLLTLKLPGDLHHESVGRAVKGVKIRIDPEALPRSSSQQSASGEGEILAKGPNVFSGYHNLPDKTDAAFNQEGWFRTGDLGHLDSQGYLYVTGRVSTLIVTKSGENVQPDEIEAHLEAHPLIREAGVLQLEDSSLAAVIVPEIREIRSKEIQDVNQAVLEAIDGRSKKLPSYQHINDVGVTRSPLPRTRLGKIRRHLLADIFQGAKKEQDAPEQNESGAVAVSEMSVEDQSLLENPAAAKVWDWLAERYSKQRLSPDTSPELDLGVDSMEWLNITLKIRQRVGIELEEETISEIATVRDLLKAVVDQSTAGEVRSPGSPLEEPEKHLSDSQMRWLKPPSIMERRLARGLFAINHLIVTRFFRLRSRGLENLPDKGPFIIAPNHLSYLDPFAVAAALGFERLRRVFWAGFTGAAFKNPFFRYFSRLSRTVPVDPARGMISSLAFGAAVLKREHGLIWFPEGRRSPDSQLQPFKTGVGLLLEHYPVPVIPAFIRGTERILPPGRPIPRPGTVAIIFGRPADVADLARNGNGEEKKERIASALRAEVAQLEK